MAFYARAPRDGHPGGNRHQCEMEGGVVSGFWYRTWMTLRFYFSWTSLKSFYEDGVPGAQRWTGRKAGARVRKRKLERR